MSINKQKYRKMNTKKCYRQPLMTVDDLRQHLLAGSEQGLGGPSATFMSNPTIGDMDEE